MSVSETPPSATSASRSTLSVASTSDTTTPATPSTTDELLPAAPIKPGTPLFRLSGTAGKAAHPLPHSIAHRGFGARFPENSLAAFRGALGRDGHATAIETDVHLTHDKVVVLSHDPTLRRCFGRPERIADCDWADLATLRTVSRKGSPGNGDGGGGGEPMARLSDLLALLAEPAHADAWVLLDIKRTNPIEEIISRIAMTLADAGGGAAWTHRVVLGCWSEDYMQQCQAVLPAYPVAYIGFSMAMAEALLRCDDDEDAKDYNRATIDCFNLVQDILMGARGAKFLSEAHARGRTVLAWTVNAEEWMDWSIDRGLDGVVTDDPAKFDSVRRQWTPRSSTVPHPSGTRSVTGWYLRRWARLYARVGLVRMVEFVFVWVSRLRFGSEESRVRTALKQG